MNSESIIIGLLCVGLILSLFFYLKARQRNDKLHQLQNFLNLAEKQDLIITQFDLWVPGCAIGIDIKKKKVLYIQNQQDDNQESIIDLSRAENCWVDTISRDSNGNKIIEKVLLVIASRDSKNKGTSLLFYNKEKSFLLNEELSLAKKWESIINTTIKGSTNANLVIS